MHELLRRLQRQNTNKAGIAAASKDTRASWWRMRSRPHKVLVRAARGDGVYCASRCPRKTASRPAKQRQQALRPRSVSHDAGPHQGEGHDAAEEAAAVVHGGAGNAPQPGPQVVRERLDAGPRLAHALLPSVRAPYPEPDLHPSHAPSPSPLLSPLLPLGLLLLSPLLLLFREQQRRGRSASFSFQAAPDVQSPLRSVESYCARNMPVHSHAGAQSCPDSRGLCMSNIFVVACTTVNFRLLCQSMQHGGALPEVHPYKCGGALSSPLALYRTRGVAVDVV